MTSHAKTQKRRIRLLINESERKFWGKICSYVYFLSKDGYTKSDRNLVE